MTLKTKALLNISITLALICCIILSLCGFAESCRDMYENIIRIRVIANSDSTEDQELKLYVRDCILDSTELVFSKTSSYEDAVIAADSKLEYLKVVAKDAIIEKGFNYNVTAELRDEFFETRVYDDFTLPSGEYKTLVVTIGSGKGENWWCVMYPKVCVGACSGELTDAIKEISANYAENGEKYVLKFKVVEIFQKFKKII